MSDHGYLLIQALQLYSWGFALIKLFRKADDLPQITSVLKLLFQIPLLTTLNFHVDTSSKTRSTLAATPKPRKKKSVTARAIAVNLLVPSVWVQCPQTTQARFTLGTQRDRLLNSAREPEPCHVILQFGHSMHTKTYDAIRPRCMHAHKHKSTVGNVALPAVCSGCSRTCWLHSLQSLYWRGQTFPDEHNRYATCCTCSILTRTQPVKTH